MKTSDIIKSGAIAFTIALSVSSCGHGNKWQLKGQVEGAEGKFMLLQASTNGRWYTLDTVKIDNNGNFKIEQTPAGYPDIYRLTLDGRSLYFPVDSVETVNVNATFDGFDTDYVVSGTAEADRMMEANNLLNATISQVGAEAAVNDPELKKRMNELVLADPSGIVAYYIINRNIQGRQLYDPRNKMDNRMIGAVANAFNDFRSTDPRTSYLKSLFLSHRGGAPADTIHAKEVAFFDINLYDNTGKQHSLSEVASQGKVVLLNFTVYGAENSPAFNRHLNEIYQRYHGQGLEIYQVSVDDDEFVWKQSARNLPWITVYNSPVDGMQNLVNFNVTALPTSFIIDRRGELAERVDDESKLTARVAAYM